jgi:excisionase family DNA binding protein
MLKQETGKFQNSKQQACLPFLLGRLRERTMEERWFSTSEIAAYLGVKQDKIYRLIGTEGLPAHKTGRFWKFRKDEIDAWKGKSTPAGKKGKSKTKPEPDLLSRLGFSSGKGGVHTARTMMLQELESLLAYVENPEAKKEDYQRAVTEENCLGKRSTKTRTLTFRHLAELYSLDRTCLLFRSLLFFWSRDLPGRPLLALLCAYARDALLRSSASFILEHPESSTVSRESLEALLDAPEPGRFSKATLTSTAQNINSTWTQSGHLRGKAKKVRTQASPTAGSAAYALLLGYLSGARGQGLFSSEYAGLLDCPPEKTVELAEEASRKGWIVFKRVSDVAEAGFPNLIGPEEKERLREQN